ncbi:MAG: UDP-N-acetylmuramoyl-tripeptide--D-alanyl-D-alanine ligase [Flavobacteriaceae bacterium]|jgi:UDP-N-acetylmuramoyl-tripeptide--D-alanyl-D-alanine ligase|nr:UDP-N-acetylmuramoyl-tripeptide--D-alanyl-D-alanine ligase [Flavobacteriaceae bacterium]
MTIQELYYLYIQSTGVATDTRKIADGSLFFALKGDNFNGNLFAKDAIKSGASAAIVDEEEFSDPENRIFYLENALLSLQSLARYHRSQLTIPVIGLTGSNGKTTTKELIASVLKEKFTVLYTQGNLNNHIGVPLTILSIKPEHEIAIIEMGANHLKEIELLTEISQPDIGYITNFGKAHLEGFGGEEGVIKGKSELYDFLRKSNRIALINTDDPKQTELASDIKKISFGTGGNYHFSLLENPDHRISIEYNGMVINSLLTGNYNFSNICAAASLGLYYGLTPEQVKQGIENYLPQNQRSQIVEKNGIVLVLDTYNANPTSMEASLKNFSSFEGSKTIIIGDMFELGKDSAQEHQKIAELAEISGFDSIYLLGENFFSTVTHASNIQKFHSTKEMEHYLKDHKISTKNILLKGSRGMALEKLIDYLT